MLSPLFESLTGNLKNINKLTRIKICLINSLVFSVYNRKLRKNNHKRKEKVNGMPCHSDY